jgi:hypothetical protein
VKGQPTVVAVSRSPTHSFQKTRQPTIRLIAGMGVEQDAHNGRTVRHRSRVARDPTQPNLRQVHLIATEMLAELETKGFRVEPGALGENITTRGLDLLGLGRGTQLRIGPDAILQVTGLRNPCAQIDGFQTGLLKAVLDRDAAGQLVRKAGIMTIVLAGGDVRPGDEIRVDAPAGPFEPLDVV